MKDSVVSIFLYHLSFFKGTNKVPISIFFRIFLMFIWKNFELYWFWIILYFWLFRGQNKKLQTGVLVCSLFDNRNGEKIYFFKIRNSTRLLRWRVSSTSFEAIGSEAPTPLACRRLDSIPFLITYSITCEARRLLRMIL